jgi:hypothetical protein
MLLISQARQSLASIAIPFSSGSNDGKLAIGRTMRPTGLQAFTRLTSTWWPRAAAILAIVPSF